MSEPEKIAKLPKWAQDHIRDIQRQRDIAVRALDQYTDNQTPSPFYVQEMECVEKGAPKFYTRYIHGHRMNVIHQGIELQILLRDDHIDLSWSGYEKSMAEIAMIPASFQRVRLLAKDRMRP